MKKVVSGNTEFVSVEETSCKKLYAFLNSNGSIYTLRHSERIDIREVLC